MTQRVDPKVLRQRERETYRQLGFFLLDDRVPPAARRVFAPFTCLSLLYRLVGEQKFGPNLKTVWFVIKHYFSRRWQDHELNLWCFSLRRIHRKSDAEIVELLTGAPVEDEEWPEIITK